MSQTKGESGQTDRRSFLKLASLGTVTGGVALAVTGQKADAAEAPASPTAAGYRETDHVKTVYALSKF